MKTPKRTQETGEVFTPNTLVLQMLKQDSSKTFLDNSCGNGQFLIQILKQKLKYHSIEDSLSTIYGVDLMADNICDTIARLIFYKNLQEDIFDEKGQPNPDLDFDGYDDHNSFEILRDNKFKRKYDFKNNTILVRNKKNKWWLLEYRFNKERWQNLPNIICADALKYHYRFDNSYPYDGEEEDLI